MNNQTTEDTNQYTVWICQGTNWTAKIPTDNFNSQFSPLMQAEEVATKAIQQIKGENLGIIFEFSGEEKIPEIGGVILVYLLNTDPKDGFLLFVHELLANAGYYKDSFAIQKMTEEVLNEESKALPKPDKKPKKPRKKKKE